MNIFVLDHDPIRAASFLCNKHLSKMLIECGQMLATSLRSHGADDDLFLMFGVTTSKGTAWRSTHKNHPCTIWTSRSRSNYLWLCDHADAIAQEYTNRYGKIHACELPIKAMRVLASLIPEGDLSEFALAMPDDHKIKGDAVRSYRSYYHTKEFASWTNADVPYWWQDQEKYDLDWRPFY